MNNLYDAMAAALGEEWMVTSNDGRFAILRRIDGLELELWIDDERLRTVVRPVPGIDLDGYPCDFGARPAPQITAHVQRGAVVLAADIRRRLLPVAEPWHAAARTKASLAADMHQRQEESLTELLALPHTQRSDAVENRIYGIDWRADVYATIVSLHFSSLSLEMALRLLRLYHGIDPTNPEASDVPTR